MVRKTLLGLIGCALVALPAFATEGPVNGSVSVGVVSSYMWNGFDRVVYSGLDTGPAIQPALSFGVRNTGLSLDLGGSFVVNDNSELHEATYGVKFVRPVTPMVNIGAGYTYYDNMVSEVQGIPVEDVNGHEAWGSVELQTQVGVSPGLAVKYEKPTQDAFDPYTVVVGSLKYAMPLSGVTLGSAGMSLNWGANVIYNSGVKVNDAEMVKSGVSAVTFGVNAPVQAGGFVVTPSLNYQVSVSETAVGVTEDLNPDLFWATIGVSYGF